MKDGEEYSLTRVFDLLTTQGEEDYEDNGDANSAIKDGLDANKAIQQQQSQDERKETTKLKRSLGPQTSIEDEEPSSWTSRYSFSSPWQFSYCRQSSSISWGRRRPLGGREKSHCPKKSSSSHLNTEAIKVAETEEKKKVFGEEENGDKDEEDIKGRENARRIISCVYREAEAKSVLSACTFGLNRAKEDDGLYGAHPSELYRDHDRYEEDCLQEDQYRRRPPSKAVLESRVRAKRTAALNTEVLNSLLRAAEDGSQHSTFDSLLNPVQFIIDPLPIVRNIVRREDERRRALTNQGSLEKDSRGKHLVFGGSSSSERRSRTSRFLHYLETKQIFLSHQVLRGLMEHPFSKY